MKEQFVKVDLSNTTWDSACFRSMVVRTKEVIYKFMENGSSVDSKDSKNIGIALNFLSELENSVPLFNGCSPADSVEFPKIENARELVKSFFPKGFNWLPEYSQVAEKLDLSASFGLGLFFYGGTGRGKSTILLGLSQWLKENKYPFVSEVSLRDHFVYGISDLMNKFQEGVILLDNVNGDYGSFLQTIDKVEKSRGKFRVFAASSLSAADFVNEYGSRCASILNAICSRIEFKGESLREKVDLKW